jgi:hypothetical protein
MNNISSNKHISADDLTLLTHIRELIRNGHDDEALVRLKLLAVKHPFNVELRSLLLSLVAKTVVATPITMPHLNSFAR